MIDKARGTNIARYEFLLMIPINKCILRSYHCILVKYMSLEIKQALILLLVRAVERKFTPQKNIFCFFNFWTLIKKRKYKDIETFFRHLVTVMCLLMYRNYFPPYIYYNFRSVLQAMSNKLLKIN